MFLFECSTLSQRRRLPFGFKRRNTYTPDEVDEALEIFRDPYGLVGSLHVAGMLTRCGCKDPNDDSGKKKRVCVPPKPGFMCERSDCVAVKMKPVCV